MGITDTLTLILLVLKYFGLIGISWFACFVPLLIGIGITIILKCIIALLEDK